ncbi:MAG: hypothetical protein ABGW50_01580 [Thermococcus sp.]
MVAEVLVIPEMKTLYSAYISEDQARRIFGTLALAADELPQHIVQFDWESKRDLYSVDEWLDIEDKIADWAYEDAEWPENVRYVRFEIEDPRDRRYSIYVEIGPCKEGKCLLEVYRVRIF